MMVCRGGTVHAGPLVAVAVAIKWPWWMDGWCCTAETTEATIRIALISPSFSSSYFLNQETQAVRASAEEAARELEECSKNAVDKEFMHEKENKKLESG